MKDASQILQAWNETDPIERRALVDAMMAKGVIYNDAHKREETIGTDAFDDFLAFFQDRVSGATVVAEAPIQRVGRAQRFGFRVSRGDTLIGEGSYFALLNDDGLISHLYGFVSE